jgi:transcriptional regulator with XRE-family HTH domain
MARGSVESAGKLTLGQYLASIRNDRKLSQRDVEKATNKVVSNAYLSQIENDQIKKPSPNILHGLAVLYAVSYEDLMERAGFVVPTRFGTRTAKRPDRAMAFAGHHLTSEEERELVQYLGYLRTRKKSADPDK